MAVVNLLTQVILKIRLQEWLRPGTEVKLGFRNACIWGLKQVISLWYNKKYLGFVPRSQHSAPKTLGISEVMSVFGMLMR